MRRAAYVGVLGYSDAMRSLLMLLPLLAVACGGTGRAPADAGAASDGGVSTVGSTASEPAVILRSGSGGVLLRGVVLAPSGPLAPGEVLVQDGVITCVAASCAEASGAAAATAIDTRGVISPGLIDAHNHLAYNFMPEWAPSPRRFFRNRYEWAEDPQYEAFVKPYTKYRSTGTHFCPAAKWGELRSLVHGTTTVQGQSFQQSCLDWGVRNAEHYHGLGHNHMRTEIGSVRDLTDADARNLLESFGQSTRPATRYAVHMQEGIAGDGVEVEFESFAGRDPRPNRHRGVSLLVNETSVLIHALGLTEAQLLEARAANAKFVWSPSSNLALYGETAPIRRMLQLDLVVGIGPDWTPSGEDDLLAELRFAHTYGERKNIAELTPERLWRMATSDGARVVGLQAHVGRIEVGLRADLTVFGRSSADPYRAVLDSHAADVRLVFIDGRGHYGDASLKDATARNAFCETYDACGTSKYLCVQDSPTATNRRNEVLAEVRAQLFNILEGVGYPADERYGRGGELLPLTACGR